MTLKKLQQHLRSLSTPEGAALCKRFFKTAPGEYAHGDVFLGLRAAQVHAAAKTYQHLELSEVEDLLQSAVHEDRTVALLILVRKGAKKDDAVRQACFDLYLRNTKHINNWDLVDCSARDVVGRYLEQRDRKPLLRLAKSKLLWERRIAIVATHHFIRLKDYADTLRVSEILLADAEDLIHKAVGWMLREVGKRDEDVLLAFLEQHAARMPRTMLRYAIEHLPPQRRQALLEGSKQKPRKARKNERNLQARGRTT